MILIATARPKWHTSFSSVWWSYINTLIYTIIRQWNGCLLIAKLTRINNSFGHRINQHHTIDTLTSCPYNFIITRWWSRWLNLKHKATEWVNWYFTLVEPNRVFVYPFSIPHIYTIFTMCEWLDFFFPFTKYHILWFIYRKISTFAWHFEI